ncbi:MAG: DUF294 nucleotidyltransferase-like domain-containing protein [Planctomycetaceae bacterium]|jgi:hypothetical protein|nr:DUF294 nucleotidyltransferase-like domain-containing protein [Planctomycetaceae bacterium]MDG2389799.1 DUF294 nucleotidyltransferase-like domain-containing protein [Planctomycetaceae bacterium]
MFDFDSTTQNSFPASRESLIEELPSVLAESWQRSRETHSRLRELFLEKPLSLVVETMYVCGSLGRMEQIPSSDCDLVIVTSNDILPNSDLAQELYGEIWSRLESLGMIRPKPNGIFSETVTWKQLVDPTHRGQVDEDQFVYGKRIQLLLDSQPIFQADRFRELQRVVLNRFSREPESNNPSQWLGLLIEIIRYWKALGARSLWLDDRSLGEWRYINVKFRHSRNLLIFGLLILVGEASAQTGDSQEWLMQRLPLTPLERVCLFADDNNQKQILDSYNLFLRQMSSAEIVKILRDDSNAEKEPPEFRELAQNASRFLSSILETLKTRGLGWPTEVRHEVML